MKKIATLAIIASLSGCTKESAKPLCRVGIKAAVYSAQGMATALDCKNVGSIAADFSAPIENLDLCKAPMATGALGDLVCPALSAYVVKMGVKVTPAEWECKGGPALAQAAILLANSCKAIIPY